MSPCLSGQARPSFLLLPVNDIVCAAAFSSACLSLSGPSTASASTAPGLDSWVTALSQGPDPFSVVLRTASQTQEKPLHGYEASPLPQLSVNLCLLCLEPLILLPGP